MIPTEALGLWLENREAQLDTVKGFERVTERLRQLPALARLQKKFDDTQQTDADRVLALAQEFVMTPGAVGEFLAVMIAAAEGNPYFRPYLGLVSSEVHTGLLLFDRPALTLTLGVMSADAIAAKRAERQGGASLVFNGRRSLFHFVTGGGTMLSFWEAPRIEAGFTADTSGRCRFVKRRRIEDGENLDIDGRHLTFIVEEAEHDIVFVAAETSLGAGPLSVEYDSATLRFTGASSTDEASSRTQMMLALLRRMDRRDATPVFEEMLQSEHFYARWQTMREFLALDAAAALPHLRVMAAADRHPEVRQAAAHTLAQFFPDESQPRKEMVECPC